MKNPPIPKGYVLLVQHAIQGHPESPCLWEKHINNILQEVGFKSTTHERCIYQTKIKNHQVLFLRQVDNFAVTSNDPSIANTDIAQIRAKLHVPLNHLGVIAKFNGIDVLQMRSHIKISCQTYLDKVLDGHKWQERQPGVDPIPMQNDSVYQAAIKIAIPPSDPGKQKELHDAHFNYRQVIGEVIYAITMCRPNISFVVIKLSQYSANPAEIHYKAARQLMKYLALTKNQGITYWQQQLLSILPATQSDPCIS